MLNGDKYFKPLYLVAEWQEQGTLTKRVTVVINLPSGVVVGDLIISVPEGGLFLEFSVRWPQQLVNLELLHMKWLRSNEISMSHRKIEAFEHALKRKCAKVTDYVMSTTKIPLPLAVQTHIEQKSNIAFA